MKISQVRGWHLSDLTDTATGLRNGAAQLDEHALTVINGMDGVSTNWEGEARDAYAVKVKDHGEEFFQRKQRWNNAAAVLDKGAQQMGLLRDELLKRVDDPAVQQMFNITDDGGVTLKPEYQATLKSPKDVEAAQTRRAEFEHALRALLATADVAGQQYDWQATNALRGEKDSDRPFAPQIPDHPTPPTFSKDNANKDGSGPDQYGIDKPGFWTKPDCRPRERGRRDWSVALARPGNSTRRTCFNIFLMVRASLRRCRSTICFMTCRGSSKTLRLWQKLIWTRQCGRCRQVTRGRWPFKADTVR